LELQQVGRILPICEYWYYDAKSWKKAYDFEFIKGGKKDLINMELSKQLKLQEQLTKEAEPSLLQHPIAIVIYIGIAFGTGLAIGL
jgi:hypothetical protein